MTELQPLVTEAKGGELQVLLDYAGETVLVSIFPRCDVTICDRCNHILTILDPGPLCDHVIAAREAIAALEAKETT